MMASSRAEKCGMSWQTARLILFGGRSLRRAIKEYMIHHLQERNHQGLNNKLIDGDPTDDPGEIECRERLGGLLKYYHRAA